MSTTVEHKIDVDQQEDGCLARALLEFRASAQGCTLQVEFATVTGAWGGLKAVTFNADSFCPGFPDAKEGVYTAMPGYGPWWYVGPNRVTQRLAESACITGTTISFLDRPIRLRRSDGAIITVNLKSLSASGTAFSKGNANLTCVNSSGCGIGYKNGGDGWCVASGCSPGYHDDGTGTCVASGCAATYNYCGGSCVKESITSCGASCSTCPAPTNGTATCISGTCGITCNGGYHACSGQCVSDSSPLTCGSSCTPCSAPASAVSICSSGTCDFLCSASSYPCDAGCCPVPVSAGMDHTCAVLSDGGVKCWGANFQGQLGDGTATLRLLPTPVVGLDGGIRSVSAGQWATCAVPRVGTLKCWGRNTEGQLGDGTTTDRLTPIDVTGTASTPVGVSVGLGHTCDLSNTGAARCWGKNTYGQLGDGTTTDRSSPAAVPGLLTVSVVAANGSSYAVTSSGGLKKWGDNQLSPADAFGLTSGVAVASISAFNGCLVTTAGAARCWGANFQGGVGNGSTLAESSPITVIGLSSGVRSVAVGWNHSCAVMISGALKCWGGNSTGQVGDGTTTNRMSPVNVVGLSSSVAGVSLGQAHSCAYLFDGGTLCWGDNSNGQLGDGTSTSRTTPTPVIGL